jgi:SAM-dependent methyltransferase
MTPLLAEFSEKNSPKIPEEGVPLCPLCGSDAPRPFADGYDYELRTCRNQWRFVACRDCAHVWLHPRPALAELSVIYPPHYYAYNYQSAVNFIARKGKEIMDAGKMRSILRQLPQPPRSFLDVGCGDGRFLKLLEKFGVPRSRNFGLELDAGVVDRLKEQGFPNVFCERVEDTHHIPAAGIDLITLFHVIEHVDRPGRVIGQLAEWLSPDGVLAIETPNLDSWDARLFHRTYWGGYHFPRHWNLFTARSLKRLLADNGLEYMEIKYQTGHSFWMYSLHHWLRYECGWRKLSGWFDPLTGTLPLIMFTGLDKLRGLAGFPTSAMLVLARKRWAGSPQGAVATPGGP